jgi:hypothetical protein
MSIQYRNFLRATNEGAFSPGNNPSNWQFDYNFNQDPTGNQFSEAELITGANPTANLIQGGPPANRGIDIIGEDPPHRFNHIFQLNSAPQLNPSVGCTAEFELAVTAQSGYRYVEGGVEFTYVNGAGSLSIASDWIGLSVPNTDPSYYEVLEDNTARATYRLTIDASRVCRVYKNGSLLITSEVMGNGLTNGLRFMFWGQGGV